MELSRRLQKEANTSEFIKIADDTTKVLIQDDSADLMLEDLPDLIHRLETKMNLSAKELNFEEAAMLRDRIKKLRTRLIRG